jgi:hypothetical protein
VTGSLNGEGRQVETGSAYDHLRRVRQIISESRVRVYKDGPHRLMISRTDQLNRDLQTFIKVRVERAGGPPQTSRTRRVPHPSLFLAKAGNHEFRSASSNAPDEHRLTPKPSARFEHMPARISLGKHPSRHSFNWSARPYRTCRREARIACRKRPILTFWYVCLSLAALSSSNGVRRHTSAGSSRRPDRECIDAPRSPTAGLNKAIVVKGLETHLNAR